MSALDYSYYLILAGLKDLKSDDILRKIVWNYPSTDREFY